MGKDSMGRVRVSSIQVLTPERAVPGSQQGKSLSSPITKKIFGVEISGDLRGSLFEDSAFGMA